MCVWCHACKAQENWLPFCSEGCWEEHDTWFVTYTKEHEWLSE